MKLHFSMRTALVAFLVTVCLTQLCQCQDYNDEELLWTKRDPCETRQCQLLKHYRQKNALKSRIGFIGKRSQWESVATENWCKPNDIRCNMVFNQYKKLMKSIKKPPVWFDEVEK